MTTLEIILAAIVLLAIIIIVCLAYLLGAIADIAIWGFIKGERRKR